MKWPGVALLERLLTQSHADLLAERAASDAARIEADTRYNALLEKFTALRLAGAVVPEPVPLPIERKRDPCAEAIMAKAGRDTHLQQMMFEQLGKDRRAGKSDDAILVEIQTGEPPDQWSMPT